MQGINVRCHNYTDFERMRLSKFYTLAEYVLRHHIATHSLSSPITSETVSKKFPGNFQKFPKKLEALLLVAQLGTGNFYRF